jgi:hypothetical protein
MEIHVYKDLSISVNTTYYNILGLVIAHYRSAIHISSWSKEKTNINNISNINCLANHITNGWVLSHTCVGVKLKVRHCISVLFHSLRPWGSGDARGVRGRVRRPQPVFLSALFSARRAIRLRGGGTQAHINPLPSGCNHHRDAHYALSIINSIKSPTQQFLRAYRAKDKRSNEGEGGKWHK